MMSLWGDGMTRGAFEENRGGVGYSLLESGERLYSGNVVDGRAGQRSGPGGHEAVFRQQGLSAGARQVGGGRWQSSWTNGQDM